MTIYTVNTTSDVVDSNFTELSLREAIMLANADDGADLINFASELEGATITLVGGELSVSKDLILNGDSNGDGKADITISGNKASRILNISGAETDVDILSLTLTDGSVGGVGSSVNGGAIYADNINSIDVIDTTIQDSGSSHIGGGIFALNTVLNVVNCLIEGNFAGTGGAGIFGAFSAVRVINSTIDSNWGIAGGGGIAVENAVLDIYNSTITNNFHWNIEGSGGGVSIFQSGATLVNSIIAGNTFFEFLLGRNGPDDVGGTFNTVSSSFIGLIRKTGLDSWITQNPLLGELLDNGGTVLTRSPLDGSPVIGAGNGGLLLPDVWDLDGDNDRTELMPVDGRDGTRIVGGALDIGAVEQIVDEKITGTAGNNTIIGGLGNDTLSGGLGNDSVLGNEGDDAALGDEGADTLGGGQGNDTLSGGSEGDSLNGAKGNDTLFGNEANDSVNGGDGQDTVGGGQGDDTLFGGADGDSLNGALGNDSIYGGAVVTNDATLGADTITGGGGDDYVRGQAGADVLYGDVGLDDLGGGSDDDQLYGGSDNDQLNGAAGADTVNGGRGSDTLYGGADNDRFVFLDGDGTDTVADFANNGVEKFDLSGLVSGAQSFGQLVVTDTAGPGVTVSYGTGSFLVLNINATAQIDVADFLF